MDEPPSSLTLFDFDGTLVRLATDYARLRARLAELALEAELTEPPGLLELILALEAAPAVAHRTRAAVTEAELGGLREGEDVERGVSLYRAVAEGGGTVAVVSHNGAAAIEHFLRSRRLPPPDAVLDRSALGAPKHESDAVEDYVQREPRGAVTVVGDGDADRLLAARLDGEYIHIDDDRGAARLLQREGARAR